MPSTTAKEIKLNAEQQKAVHHKEGPLLILAGAGAGKTRVITERIINLIKDGVAPSSIVAITFTNKAAAEMRERVTERLKETMPHISFEHGGPVLATFHSLAVQMLRQNYKLLNIPKFFTIYDRADSIEAIKRAMKDTNISSEEWSAQKIISAISRHKSKDLSPEQFIDSTGRDYYSETIYLVWQRYQQILFTEKAFDFDDLLIATCRLLENRDVAEHYWKKWQYIHIDEYQDTNKPQYMIANRLAEQNRNICVVGDVDQMIYGWRGADLANILNFEKDYPEAIRIVLEENYRSTSLILEAANAVIEQNKQRFKKTMFTKGVRGEKITLFTALTASQESIFIAEKALELIREGVDPNQIAVLYRTNFQSRLLEEAMLQTGVEYQLLGTRFFERKEIKDVLSYLKVALNPNAWTDFKRAVSFPPRGVGPATLLKVIEGREDDLSGAAKTKVESFKTLIKKIEHKIQTSKPTEVIKFVVEEAGIEQALLTKNEDDFERLQNIKELATVALRFEHYNAPEGIEKMLEEASLMSDQDNLMKKQNGVRLMTVHTAKGLEFDYCFITGLEEGLFPLVYDKSNKDDIEEERRLCYVALTRARKKVFLTRSVLRTIFGVEEATNPSRFLAEIPTDTIEEDESGIYMESGGERSILFD